MNEILLSVLLSLAVLLATLCATLILNRVMKTKKFVFKPVLNICVTTGLTLVELLLWGICPRVLIGTVLSLILLYASCKDVTIREADDWLSVMIVALAIGSISFDRIGFMVLGAAAVFVPQLLITIMGKKSKLQIGGADIKISTATAFLLGLWPGLFGFMLGLLISIVCQLILTARKKEKSTEPFPLLPYLSVGLMIGYLL